jgi:hypothetical protein
MSLINTTLTWLLSRRLARIDRLKSLPGAAQERVFRYLIRKGQRTEWGRAHGYRSIASVADFQRQVPVSGYEELFPYIERVMRGEPNVLWSSPIRWFSKSSGTTNARSKFIPVSPEALDDCHFKGGKDMMALYVANRPDTQVFTGKGLSIGGSLHANPYSRNSAVGDISAVVMKNLPTWGQVIRTPALEVALMDEWEAKLDQMARITAQQNVTSILGVPTWTMVLIQKILEQTRTASILDVWPNFEVFVHGAVAFQPYRELFQQHIFQSQSVGYQEVYNASEGYFAIQDDMTLPNQMMLMPDYGIFYEFVPIEEADKPFPKAYTLEEVELNRNYALIISTNAGLWRYRIGDTVRFTSLYPHRVRISGRTKQFINAFGEEVIVENADMAVTQACAATGAVIADYTAGPVYMQHSLRGQKGGHEWVIEFAKEPDSLGTFTQVLDQTLRQLNSDYDAKRYRDMALVEPVVHAVARGTFYAWMTQRGKVGGQHKVPRLSNSREYVDELLGGPLQTYL